jgi:hypothetical protein
MISYYRIYQIYIELIKSIKYKNNSHEYILDLISEVSTRCVYSGIEYTIQNIIQENKNFEIVSFSKDNKCKTFHILCNDRYVNKNIFLKVQKNTDKKQITFSFHIYFDY